MCAGCYKTAVAFGMAVQMFDFVTVAFPISTTNTSGLVRQSISNVVAVAIGVVALQVHSSISSSGICIGSRM